MRWVWRSWRVSHGISLAWAGVLLTVAGLATASETHESSSRAAWLLAFPDNVEAIDGTEGGAESWRHDPLLGEASLALFPSDATEVSALFVRFAFDNEADRETVRQLAESAPYPLWSLEERADLSFIPEDWSSRDAEVVLRRYEIPRRRLARFERRLAQRVNVLRIQGEMAIVVLQGENTDPTRMQLAVIESARPGTPAPRLAATSADRGQRSGRLRATGATDPEGLLGALFVRDEPAAPLPLVAEAAPMDARKPAPARPIPAPHAPTEPAFRDPLEQDPPQPDPETHDPVPPVTIETHASEAPTSPTAPLTPIGAARDEPTVHEAIQGWADAWTNQRVDAYLAAYSNRFRPARRTLDEWQQTRREKLEAPAWIEIRLDQVEIEVLDDGKARAEFDQVYRSDQYRDRVRKRLDLHLDEDGRWRITRELVLRVLPMPAAPMPAAPMPAAQEPAA